MEGQGAKNFTPTNIIDIHTRLEVLIGLRVSCHTGTLAEASNLINDLYKRGYIQNKQQYRNALDNFYTKSMELPSKHVEQIAFNTRPNFEELMLVVTAKCIHEEHQSEPLQTNVKKFKIAATFELIITVFFRKQTKTIIFSQYQLMMLISIKQFHQEPTTQRS